MDLLKYEANGSSEISFKLYSINIEIEQKIRDITIKFLKNQGVDSLINPIYSVVTELLTIMLRLNFKNIYFESYQKVKNGALSYETSLKLFDLEMDDSNYEHFENIALSKNLYVYLSMSIKNDNLKIKIFIPIKVNSYDADYIVQNYNSALKGETLKNQHETNPQVDKSIDVGFFIVSLLLKKMGMNFSAISVESPDNGSQVVINIPLKNSVK